MAIKYSINNYFKALPTMVAWEEIAESPHRMLNGSFWISSDQLVLVNRYFNKKHVTIHFIKTGQDFVQTVDCLLNELSNEVVAKLHCRAELF